MGHRMTHTYRVIFFIIVFKLCFFSKACLGLNFDAMYMCHSWELSSSLVWQVASPLGFLFRIRFELKDVCHTAFHLLSRSTLCTVLISTSHADCSTTRFAVVIPPDSNPNYIRCFSVQIVMANGKFELPLSVFTILVVCPKDRTR